LGESAEKFTENIDGEGRSRAKRGTGPSNHEREQAQAKYRKYYANQQWSVSRMENSKINIYRKYSERRRSSEIKVLGSPSAKREQAVRWPLMRDRLV
jgi:hypothetical protein